MPEQIIDVSRRNSGSTSAKSSIPWRTTLVAIGAMGIAGAIGYYAWNLRDRHLVALENLEVSREKAATADQERRDKEELSATLASCEKDKSAETQRCSAAETSVAAMQNDLSATRSELDTLRKQREETAQRLAAFRDLTQKFQKMIDGGKLDVVIRKGRMIVKLPAGVLFGSGSADLSREGELALMEVAVVLRNFDGRSFMVEGHTDDRPLENSKEGKYRNNWELATARAVTVTQFLIEARMKPENLVAAGRGEFDPVGNNKTAQGRAENRRIEIVLLPKIEEMPALPDSAEEGAETGRDEAGAPASKDPAKK